MLINESFGLFKGLFEFILCLGVSSMGCSFSRGFNGFLTAFSVIVSLVCLMLAIGGLIRILPTGNLGHRQAGNVMPTPQEYNISFEEWQAPAIDYGDRNFTPPKILVKPYAFELNISQYKPTCEECIRRNASYLYKSLCYYTTKTTHSFQECFSVCANLVQCYYFYAPNKQDMSIVTSNIKPNSSLWVGAFRRANSSSWEDIFGQPVAVHDIYESFCAYLLKTDIQPRSYFFCGFKRPCLCASKSIAV